MAAPILLCDTKGMDRKRWLECRMHGPKGDIEYTIGGSDVSVVFGENPWTTPLELWRIKRGLMKPDDSANADQKEMGHLLEPIVAHWYGKKSKNTVIEDTGLYQHAKYPYALANLDYRFNDPAAAISGILECKTTSWHKAEDWADGAIPRYYELQVRFYMAVMDLEYADITCMWGTNAENDIVIRRVCRDLSIEAMIFERLDEFIDSLKRNKPPAMNDVAPKLALEALARIYGASKAGLPTIEFPPKHEHAIRRIALLQTENAGLQAEINKNEKEIDAHSVRIAEMMKEHEHGVLETVSDKLLIDFATKTTRRVSSDLLKKNHPAVYKECLKASESRKVKVRCESVAV